MTSLRQIDANRRNARKSTGPTTEEGKHRSRRNAVRHGLTAETVIEILEDPEDYKGFELSVTADFDAQTAVERELVLRLASLLWRLRRATGIETGLLQIQGEILREIKQTRGTQTRHHDPADVVAGFGDGSSIMQPYPVWDNRRADYEPRRQCDGEDDLNCAAEAPDGNVEIGRCFLRLSNLDNGAFDRLSRYETALWRQVGQVLLTLDVLRRTPRRG